MASQADYYRAHRKAFQRALQSGCTPAEAAAEIEREDKIAACRAVETRLKAKLDVPLNAPWPAPAEQPWMMRD